MRMGVLDPIKTELCPQNFRNSHKISTMRFFILLFFFSITGCYQVERDCADFKIGTFEFEALIGTEVQKTTFVRNDSIEIDHFKGKADTSSIRWINQCEYIVQKLNPKNKAEKQAVHIKILTTEKNGYTFSYNIVGSTKSQKGTAKRIDDGI